MKTTFTQKENIESGLALVVVLLVASLLFQSPLIIRISIGLVVLLIVIPAAFYPVSLLWLNLSHLLGRVSSFLILALIFLLVVTPVGLFRRLIGKDRLRLSQFKKTTTSVFEERNHHFVKDDLLHPF